MRWSDEPERSAVRWSDSSRATRQVRSRPSAVSRVRSQAAQHGRVTEVITPDPGGAAVDGPVLGRGGARTEEGSGVSVKRAEIFSSTSAALTDFLECLDGADQLAALPAVTAARPVPLR
jgi:hypothetical protein